MLNPSAASGSGRSSWRFPLACVSERGSLAMSVSGRRLEKGRVCVAAFLRFWPRHVPSLLYHSQFHHVSTALPPSAPASLVQCRTNLFVFVLLQFRAQSALHFFKDSASLLSVWAFETDNRVCLFNLDQAADLSGLHRQQRRDYLRWQFVLSPPLCDRPCLLGNHPQRSSPLAAQNPGSSSSLSLALMPRWLSRILPFAARRSAFGVAERRLSEM